jgi:hypothetical protein
MVAIRMVAGGGGGDFTPFGFGRGKNGGAFFFFKPLREKKRNTKKIQFEQLIAYTNIYIQDGRRQRKNKEENMIQIPKMEHIINLPYQ